MSRRTLEFHHGKHHKAYVDNIVRAVKSTTLESADLETIVKSAKEKGDTKLFNNSAQAWNHDFFWNSMAPAGESALTGPLVEQIVRDFGSIQRFRELFKAEALGHFASGWIWLIFQAGRLRITSFHDADTPIVHSGIQPILTADVWEHAYYLDYQNGRSDFIDSFLDHLINWEWAAEKLQAAISLPFTVTSSPFTANSVQADSREAGSQGASGGSRGV